MEEKSFFDEKYLSQLPADPIEAGLSVCMKFFREHLKFKENKSFIQTHMKEYVDAYGFLQAYCEANKIPLSFPALDSSDLSAYQTVVVKYETLMKYLREQQSRDWINRSKQKYLGYLGKSMIYEFSEADYDRIQKLINELRETIAGAKYIEEGHRQRMLGRLEKLQNDFHRKMSNIDQFWGLLGDAGIALGAFGENAKPFFDRVREILRIVWNSQARTEGLPSTSKYNLLEMNTGDK